MGNKKIGYLIEANDNHLAPNNKDMLWASIWKGSDGKALVTMFFTKQTSPRFNEWFKSLCDASTHGHWSIIQKGTYIHGYYYKISITIKLDNAQNLLDSLNEWLYHDDNDISYWIETSKDIDTVYTELLAKAI